MLDHLILADDHFADLVEHDVPFGREFFDLGDLGGFSRSDRVTYGGFIRLEGTPSGAVVARMNPVSPCRSCPLPWAP